MSFFSQNKFCFKRGCKMSTWQAHIHYYLVSLSQIKSFQLLFCWFGIIMIINYFAIVNLSAQIEILQLKIPNVWRKEPHFTIKWFIHGTWLTDNTSIVYLYKNLFTIYFILCTLPIDQVLLVVTITHLLYAKTVCNTTSPNSIWYQIVILV